MNIPIMLDVIKMKMFFSIISFKIFNFVWLI